MNKDLVDVLACPECASPDLVVLSDTALACPRCEARYPVVNGIPQLLPVRLAASLAHRDVYAERVTAAIRDNRDSTDPNDPETDRFMWERELYGWAKEVVYRDSRAADILVSYCENGARGLCQFLRESVGGVAGKSLLYVGSGNDRHVSLPLQAEGAFIVNLDIASEPLEDLAQAGASCCVCGDARALPFRAEAFEVVFSKGSVHHSHPIDEPLQAMVRAVRPGGHLIIAEPNKHAVFELRLPGFLLPPGFGYPSPYENALSAGDVMGVLRRQGVSGFRVVALTHAPPGIPLSVAGLWDRLGRAMPWLFDRFAFEFVLYGRKTPGSALSTAG
ncbi:MAG: methyltransferase domain-containing protein [Chloroflexota bacterium]|nr:methyltransferase domain-containing protein [Chloroflexota bacterium]